MFSKSSRSEHPVAIPTFSPDAEITATLETSLGKVVCRLHAKQCPRTVGNFVGLATGRTPWKNRKGEEQTGPLYDNTIFHRVIPDFMVQAGDPEGTGMGGPGYKFGDEFVSTLRHDRPGILSMANAGPNTNGSQFFITQRPTTWLDGKHTVFGEVTEGMDVVDAILAVDRNSSDKPLKDVVLHRISIAGLEG